MITKVVADRGSRVRGLIEYLWGPGRANEHVNPHIVAAWDSSLVRPPSAPVLDSFERGLVAREMEAPLRMFDKTPGEHVYHAAVSIHADDGELTDEQWAEVAYRAADKLGLTDGPDRAAAPWIAMRHGLAAGGQDHIHFIATLCRESGHTPNIRGDWLRWREVREEFREKWNLHGSRERGAGMPGLTQAEIQRTQREGTPESARTRLARLVRSAAAGARTEADFVGRVRETGILIRPRWDTGGRTAVVGYSVAMRPERRGYKPVWFGGGRLAPDLTLPRLRTLWKPPDSAQAEETLHAWRPHRTHTTPYSSRRQLRADAWSEAGKVTADIRHTLAQLDPNDTATWASVAREAAGTLAALAARAEPRYPGPLSQAADAMARLAQTERNEQRPQRTADLRPLAGVARVITDAALAAHGGPVAVASLVMQVGRLVRQIEHTNQSVGRALEARHAARAAGHMLDYVRQVPTLHADDTTAPQPERAAIGSERDVTRIARDTAAHRDRGDGHERS